MKITILTLFPDMFSGIFNNSIIKRAIAKSIITIDIVNIRDFTNDKYGRVDSAPIGGGAGLIMKCQPIVDALKSIDSKGRKILLSASGDTYKQTKARELADLKEDIILICGHYEGVDKRIENHIDESISIGDYILTGGEIGAMVITDSIIRLLDGAIASESIVEESFENDVLEYPQYTEPYDFEGHKVPDILYSGNHIAIQKWRRKESLKLTKEKRNDLFSKLELNKVDRALLKEIDSNEVPKWEIEAIQKGHKFIKK
ncbi:MAG: tRNA (guanosine(37)-N1)-methyltransferase TrmD [Erysipelotrichaceae bacterium]|jgi:tRNA (guanine37-N1)-methyltransferase|nr:tRNA (guanosine(37)-N1)-methyltransferase TrmD [Erysipelotrichaceae bacterium]